MSDDESPRGLPLSRTRIVAYSLPSLVTSVAALPLVLLVPSFYADDLGVPLATVGLAIALSRVADVLTDPLIGSASDRWRTRLGRRKPWMILGAPLFLLAIWRVFAPAGTVSGAYLLGWSTLLYLGFTMIDLPHKAWGAELSGDYDERTRLTGWREGLSTLGQVGLLAGLVLISSRGVEAAAPQLELVAGAIVLLLPICLLVALLTVPEPAEPATAGGTAMPTFTESARLVATNPAFGRMVACGLLFVAGVAIQGTLHRLVLADVMGAEERFPLMILLENVATLLAVPVWLAISKRTDKHRALAAAALWIAVLSLPLVWLRAGDVTQLILLITIRGSSFASILFLANSIAADVIDVDTLALGRRRSGVFFAVWGMTIKLALALGVLLGTALPAALGYDPSAGAISAAVQGRLMWVYGALPAVLMAAGALVLRGFPVTRERHAEVRAALEARASGSGRAGSTLRG